MPESLFNFYLSKDCSNPQVHNRTIGQKLWRALQFGFFLVLFAFILLWNNVLIQNTFYKIGNRDFSRFFYATLEFFKGHDIYGPTSATLCRWTPLFAEHLWDLNPPHFHLFIFPLVAFSLENAFIIWGLLNVAFLYLSLKLMGETIFPRITPRQGTLAILGLFAFAGTGNVLLTWQHSFLILLPLTLGWYYAREGIWNRSGIYLGLAASIKPFLLIFLPYLLLRKQFRSAGILLCVMMGFFLSGIIIFGLEAHLSWIKTLASVSWAWPGPNVSVLGFLSRSLSENPQYSLLVDGERFITPLWMVIVFMIGIITLLATYFDDSEQAVDRAFAILPLSAILISPIGWILYLFFAIGPLVALASNWWKKPLGSFPPPRSSRKQWRNRLLLIAIPGFIIPTPFLTLFQPHPLATTLLGSIYFWSTLTVWVALLLDNLERGVASPEPRG